MAFKVILQYLSFLNIKNLSCHLFDGIDSLHNLTSPLITLWLSCQVLMKTPSFPSQSHILPWRGSRPGTETTLQLRAIVLFTQLKWPFSFHRLGGCVWRVWKKWAFSWRKEHDICNFCKQKCTELLAWRSWKNKEVRVNAQLLLHKLYCQYIWDKKISKQVNDPSKKTQQ